MRENADQNNSEYGYFSRSVYLIVLFSENKSEYFKIVRSSRSEVFCKKGFLKNFAKFTGKHLCESLFFNNIASSRPATLLKERLCNFSKKETLAQMFFCEFCEIFKNTYFYRTTPMAAYKF